jgi:hypothetical protein
MSEATEGKVEEGQDKDEPQVEGQNQHQTNETEEKARRMGWVPKDEFRGDPDKWRPADEFVQRGENQMPILRERLRHQDQQLAELRKTVKEFAEYHTKVEQNAFQRALRQLKEQQVQAVKDGDSAAFVEIDERIEKLRKDAESAPQIKAPEIKPEDHPTFKAWKSQNSWYDKDQEMTSYADNIGAHIKRTKPDISDEDFFDAVTSKVRREFPEKFENPRRSAASSVEGTGNAPRKQGKSYADLPAEAKAACDRFVKQGFTTRERYVEQFFKE